MTILEQLHEHKQDIIKMYETMSMKDIAIKYNVHIQDISNFLKINNIPKKKRISPKWSESRRNKFTNTFNSKSEEEKENIKQKRANTNLQKFGSVTNLQSKEMVEERIKKYGGNSTFYSKEIQNQIKKNNAEKHDGLANPFQWEETKNKIKQTNLEKYGDENYHNIEKIKQTNLDRYGVKSYMSTQEFREKSKQTCLERYGKDSYTKTQKYKNRFKNKNLIYNIQEKRFNTCKKNNSFKISNKEEEIYQLLLQKYFQVERQYRSELYPFNCDFYIPSLDLYIEYQGTWTHGKEPYDENNEEHKKIVELWKKKVEEINFKGQNKNFYNNAIETWTMRDPEKRKIAKENNLNWIEFFNMKEFLNWYEG